MMKRLFWIGLLFLSFSWLFFIPIFQKPDYLVGSLFIVIGLLFTSLGFYKNSCQSVDKRYLIMLLIPLVLSILVVPFPYTLGPIVLLFAGVLYSVKKYILRYKYADWILVGISTGGFILTLQALFYPLYSIFVSHGHRIDILSPLVSMVCNLFGLGNSVQNGIIFVQSSHGMYTFTTTWEKLGFYPWMNMLLGGILLMYFLSKREKIIKYILVFLALSSVYLLLRYASFIFLFTQTQVITIFWDRIVVFASFIPFSLVLMKFLHFKEFSLKTDKFSQFKFSKRKMAAFTLFFVFIFSLIGGFVFQDPGVKKEGRVLIEEYHSDWEDTTKPLDKEWYGMLSTYNYYSWAEWLDKYYEVDKNTDGVLTWDLLKKYDVLILKCPTSLYSDKEVANIVRFVEEGGGLYLIGDHTNVFGMNFYLNKVAEQFGIKFKTDATYELGTGGTSTYESNYFFPHPIVKEMDEFEFLTSCTLSAPLTSENVVIGNRLLGEPGTYSTENFFRREREGSMDMKYGLLLQVAAVKHGKGRVLAFTDSTCFSNFCMFMDGYKSFNLGVMDYLNRENSFSYLNSLFAVFAVISLLGSLYLLRREGKTKVLFVFLLAGLLAFSLATPVFSFVNDYNHSLPSAEEDYTKVCFDMEHSNVVIKSSSKIEMDTNPDKLYDTFFVWTQRVGCFPSLEDSLEKGVEKGDAVVIINPDEDFSGKEVKSLGNYLENGGKLLVMDSVINSDSTANDLLGNFNISIKKEFSNHSLYNYSLNKSGGYGGNLTSLGNAANPYLTIKGGNKTIATKGNVTSIAVKKYGEGEIIVVVDSYMFSDKVMGGTFTEPDKSLRKIYDTEYYIFEKLLFKGK